jgi:aminoglycoside phosphotransferase (APT) family kinase protein
VKEPLPPWGADCELDEAGLVLLLREQFPELAPFDARYLEQGWDSRVFLVNDEWIFRMPKRADVVPTLAVERALLPELAERLPVTVPKIELEGRPSEYFPHPFAAYRILPGDLGDALPRDVMASPSIGRQLGELLRLVHEVPIEVAREAGVRVEDGDSPEDDLRASLDTRAAEIEATLGPTRWRALQDFVAAGASPAVDREPCFTHADLDVGHLLLDPRTREITGVIDWADVAIGDPACDFVALQMRLGDDFIAAALDAYQPADPVSMHAWIQHAARCEVVVWLDECLQMGDDVLSEFLRCFDRLYDVRSSPPRNEGGS